MKLLRRILLYAGLLLFFSAAFFVLSIISSNQETPNGADPPPAPEEQLKRVQVLQVAPQPFEEAIIAPGVVEANNDVLLGAAIPGIVEKVFVKEGDAVSKGQELFQIDLRSREASLRDAQAADELARKSLERLQKVRDRGDVTAQQLDEAQSAAQQATSRLKRMEVEVSLGHIFAPVSGIIDQVEAEVGEYKGEGMLLARLLNLDRIKISVGTPERYADAVSRESEAQVLIEALGETLATKIERVAYGANSQTNTFEVLLMMDNADHRIRPGMIVKARLTVKRVPDALLIPLFSLVKKASGMNVFVEKEGMVEARPVRMGAIDGDRVEILEGLQPNERVVVIGHKDLADGQKVKVMETVTALSSIGAKEGTQ